MTSRLGDQAPERDNLLQPGRVNRNNSSFSLATRNGPGSVATFSNPPGSFSTDFRSAGGQRLDVLRPAAPSSLSYRSVRTQDGDDKDNADARVAELREAIAREEKIKSGSENLLEALNAKSAKQAREQRSKVETELNASNRKIAALNASLDSELQRSKDRSPSPVGRLSKLFRSAPTRTQSRYDLDDVSVFVDDNDAESPTFVLSEILQSLEREGMTSEYYVERANNLVDLFKRHPTLKYDLAWSIFGLRMQTMLLSESREVVAASFRLMRYAITDRKSLSIMRSLHTDYLVILSLVKETKASVEREQALKFVRAFLDVKDGSKELAVTVVRVVIAIAELHEDRLCNICMLTLAELLVRDPGLVVAAGGMRVLSNALADGSYQPAESLAQAFLFLLDTPAHRAFLRSGHELEGPMAVFIDGTSNIDDEQLRSSARIVATILKTWPGLSSFAMDDFRAIHSMTSSLRVLSSQSRDIVLDLLYDIFRIKPPSWSSSFLAGRRLTTYGRVGSFKPDSLADSATSPDQYEDLVEHFTLTVLAVFLRCGLVEALLDTMENEPESNVKRKAELLLTEVLRMSFEGLPSTWTAQLQVLPSLFRNAVALKHPEHRYVSSGSIYQLERVMRTLQRSERHTTDSVTSTSTSIQSSAPRRASDLNKDALTPQIEEGHFRAVIVESQVLATINYMKWRWDLILKIIEGPLLNPKRLEEAIKTNKFVKRLLSFYRPFKHRFSEVHNTKPNQRYVRTACALLNTLLRNPEGVKYLAEHKFMRQVAECLAQADRMSGLTSTSPMFDSERLIRTMSGGYLIMLGVLSSNVQGLEILEKWKMINMFYHIVDLDDRDDLIKLLLTSIDYTLDSHMRIILSKAMTACSRSVRIHATRILRKYATRQMPKPTTLVENAYAEWAIQLLITQLYDPEVEVCEVAVQILEEACNEPDSLEYVVRCRPALDHLGEIGAPLLLRFLSTSIGYHYLDDLDYITQEMDDWFSGRNDSYVIMVEASLAQALAQSPQARKIQVDDHSKPRLHGAAPPHFYRELSRTAEGCKLLQEKGHFAEFVNIIRKYHMEDSDQEIILKLKGAIWAVGNIGSMELSASFLESSDAVQLIVQIAQTSKVMSVRGTAFFALGLMSQSIHGQDILVQEGWEVGVDDMGNSIGICLPGDFTKLFLVSLRMMCSILLY
jgi:rapamycin-insensitive companion of mTOR